MQTYTVWGSFAGRYGRYEIIRDGEFLFVGLSREEALAKAQELASQLLPGGLVYAFEESANTFADPLDGEELFRAEVPLPPALVNDPAAPEADK